MEYHRGVVVEAARGLRFWLWRFVRGGVNGQRAKYCISLVARLKRPKCDKASSKACVVREGRGD